jgi:hypothetical protein
MQQYHSMKWNLMTVFSRVLSKRPKSCDKKFLPTKKRQKQPANPSQHLLRAWKQTGTSSTASLVFCSP